MQFIDWIFKICNNVNSFSESDYNKVCSQILFLNFGPLNNILSPYKLKEKVQEKFYLTKFLKKCSLQH